MKLWTFAFSKLQKTPIGDCIRANTTVSVTRNWFQGIKVEGYISKTYGEIKTDTYYEDKLNVKVFGIDLNILQVQSTVDHPLYSPDEAIPNFSKYKSEIGESGASNRLIVDTLKIMRDNFLHRRSESGRKPFSGGCVVTDSEEDEREVMNILRESLGFKNDETVTFKMTLPNFLFRSGNLLNE